MQSIAPVQLRQVRDLGQIVTTTFQFLKQNWRPLFRAIGTICLPLALISGFFMGKTVGDLQGMILGGNLSNANNPSAIMDLLGGNILSLLGGYLLVIAATFLMIALVHEYIRAYDLGQHNGITTAQLWSSAVSNIWSYFGGGFLSGLLIVVGFILCVIPGFYPLTVLSLVFMCHAIERRGATGSMGRSNDLVKDRFWDTLGLIIVIGLINAVINYAIMLPFTIAGFFMGFSGIMAMSEGDASGLSSIGLFTAIQFAVNMAVSMLTYPIISTALGLKYFSLVEEKEGAGLRQKVEGFEQI